MAMNQRSPEAYQRSVLSKRQLADLLDVAPQTISRWVRRGLLPPPFYLGRRARWVAEDVIQRVRFNNNRQEKVPRLRSWKTGRFLR